MPGPNNFRSQNQYLCWFAEFPQIKFTSKSGGDRSSDTTQQHPGGGGPPENIDGPVEISEVTVSKPAEPLKDAPLLQWARAWQNGIEQKLTLIVQPVTSEGVPEGEPDRYLGCSLSTESKPELSKGSSDTAMYELTVQPETKQ